MRRLLWLMLLLAACTSSTRSEKEEKDRIGTITSRILSEMNMFAFRPLQLEGDIRQISEITSIATAVDNHTRRDTIRREYIFREGMLHQVATASRRMQADTLTIRYDATGRISALIHSDNAQTYSTETYRYDTAGRYVEKADRIYSEASKSTYRYSQARDTIWIARYPEGKQYRLLVQQRGDTITTVQDELPQTAESIKIIEQYDLSNQPVITALYLGGVQQYKTLKQYDKYGNMIVATRYAGDQVRSRDTTSYVYDKKGNWTSKTVKEQYKRQTTVITRKIVYR
ncbi:hypothetical protein [Chitinophaga rhizophila]|uniref:YD repeat-containing protein n=1 Tax=Chitinophaga rhizophila TaxID=2866212 RepID=A0ABS7GCE3_9BACT|nr:hypothetical protein [Chitinophaga rhizophila]MBW8685346.1 hypothetical protein [Chitinophaga rhizophila]